jgi:hypothetical protein
LKSEIEDPSKNPEAMIGSFTQFPEAIRTLSAIITSSTLAIYRQTRVVPSRNSEKINPRLRHRELVVADAPESPWVSIRVSCSTIAH